MIQPSNLLEKFKRNPTTSFTSNSVYILRIWMILLEQLATDATEQFRVKGLAQGYNNGMLAELGFERTPF